MKDAKGRKRRRQQDSTVRVAAGRILGIKSARIKNASSETSYSRFLPVVGINRPFRRRCINRDRGRAGLVPLPPPVLRPSTAKLLP